MRATLGAGLLLVSTTLVGVAATPAEAATGCESPDTTWLGPGTEGAPPWWHDPSNWSNGVPTAESVVCIPADPVGPQVDWRPGNEAVADVIDGATVSLQGKLTVATSFDVAHLVGDGGELHGPGVTAVSGSITGNGLTLADAAEVDLLDGAVLDGDVTTGGGSLEVLGDVVLGSATVDSLGGRPFTIAEGGSLTIDDADTRAAVIGGFANHGAVTVTAGAVFMMGAGGSGSGNPEEFSDGTFTAAPDAELDVAYTELRTGAQLDHLGWVDHITVPADNTVSVADSTIYWDPAETEPNLAGAGELVATDHSTVGGRIGGSLTVRVPAGDVVSMDDAVVQDQARIRVDGELQSGEVDLNDEAVLDIYGTHRATSGGGLVDFSGTDPGVEIIHPEGQLLAEPDSGLSVVAPFVNEGTVDSGTGFIYLGPRAASPSASSGTFRADPAGNLLLGSNVEGEPPLELEQPVIEGAVQVDGPVFANSPRLRGHLSTSAGGPGTRPGRLTLSGTTTLTDGASVAGDVVVAGDLDADLGPAGTASLSGAEVNGQVHVTSGTLEVQSLAPTTLLADGTLASGEWIASLGATLDLPPVKTIDTDAFLLDPGSSFGDGLATLTGIGPNGTLMTGGDDLAVPGPFRNEGMLALFSGSRLDVGGKFRQLATGTLWTLLDSAGRGQVRAAGPRDLAGKLVVERDPAYKPPVGTVLNFITSVGAKSDDDAFDKVVSSRYGTTRKIQPSYDTNHVRLRVDRVG